MVVHCIVKYVEKDEGRMFNLHAKLLTMLRILPDLYIIAICCCKKKTIFAILGPSHKNIPNSVKYINKKVIFYKSVFRQV